MSKSRRRTFLRHTSKVAHEKEIQAAIAAWDGTICIVPSQDLQEARERLQKEIIEMDFQWRVPSSWEDLGIGRETPPPDEIPW
jgi:hypothetical protein